MFYHISKNIKLKNLKILLDIHEYSYNVLYNVFIFKLIQIWNTYVDI